MKQQSHNFTGVAHLVLAVRDMDACRILYGGELGLAELESGRDGEGRRICMFGVGPSILELREEIARPTAAETLLPIVDHYALLVEDMAQTYDLLRQKNIEFRAPPEATSIGHRNMQRILLSFDDPNDTTVQISETIDPRPHLDGRKAAKSHMASSAAAVPGLFGGIDHISTYCADFASTRAFFREILGLEEFFHSTTREEGARVGAAFAQSAFSVGGTDIELATGDGERTLGWGSIRELSFWSTDVDRTFQILEARGAPLDGPPAAWHPLPRVTRRAFSLHSPDGLPVRIAQPC